MGIVIFIVIIVILFLIGSSNGGRSSSNNTYRPPSTSTNAASLQQQRLREEENRRNAEIRRQEEQRRQEELNRQRVALRQRQEQEAETKRYIARSRYGINFKANVNQYKDILANNRVTKLYHFTDRSNIPSIKNNGGLLSWYYCEANRINITSPGGGSLSRSLDRRANVHNYVRASFVRNHPMMFVARNEGRISNPVILEISPEVVYWQRSKYSNKNATRNDAHIGDSVADLQSVRFDIFRFPNHFDLAEDVKPYYQAEILVYERIPLEFILNLDDYSTTNNFPETIDDLPF